MQQKEAYFQWGGEISGRASCHDMQDLETLIRGHCIDQTEEFLQ